MSFKTLIQFFNIRVVGGLDVLTNIEAIETDTQDRPKVCYYWNIFARKRWQSQEGLTNSKTNGNVTLC